MVDFLVRNFDNLLIGFPAQRPGGLLLSILLAIGGLAGGFVLAVPTAVALNSERRWIRDPARAVVVTIRGIPLLLLLLLFHQVIRHSLQAALATLVLFSASYQADIVLAGLRSVPSELIDGSRTLGATKLRCLFTISLPYALRVMQPAMTNQAVSLFKDTSVVVILGVADLTTTARLVLGTDVANAPYWVATYLTVGALYFVTAVGIARLSSNFDRPLRRSGHMS